MKSVLLAALALCSLISPGLCDADATDSALRLMSYNIRNGRGMDNKTDLQRTALVITRHAPDFVALQEVDRNTARSGKQDLMARLAELTGMHALYAPAIDYQGGEYGVGLLSKEKPVKHDHLALPGREEKRVLLVAEFERYIVCCTHLSLTGKDREQSVKLINERVKKSVKPVFLLGDLNAEPKSSVIASLRKDWTLLNDPKSPTFPADRPSETIDYIFGRGLGKLKTVSSEVIDEPAASDHRPVMVELKTDATATSGR